MPTPVTTARQCLTEEAARVLDDAVAVARRRCHAQTTSLHAVSALLALPSSILRDACSRSRSPAFSPRFQFSALDLCVKVSLDRLPSAKGGGEDDLPPPVSNSLMAAVKRSQANQRRQPEVYQMQITSAVSSISSIKVELKNFVVSILDDPIVSRVLGDAGFRSTEIKLAILHPPIPPPSTRFRCPPLFLCNFPLQSSVVVEDSDGQNFQRICEIMASPSGRNPLLVGFCANDALSRFEECLDKSESTLPTEIAGLQLVSIEKDMIELLSNGGSTEVFNSKMEELRSVIEKHSGPGVLVSLGELNLLVEEDGQSEDSVNFFVQKLTGLFELHKSKMWLIAATTSVTYTKFTKRFPSLETDWDFHSLAISKSKVSVGEASKSRILGSFVPLGGFFSMPSDFRNPMGSMAKTFTRCSQCNDKCDRELSAIKDGDSSVFVTDQHSSTLPSWLRTANSEMNKSPRSEITVDKAEFSKKTLELQRKWDGICQGLHHQAPKLPMLDTTMVNPMIPGSLGFQSFPICLSSGNGTLHSNDPSSLNLYSNASASAIVQKPLALESVLSMHENGDLSAHTSCSLSLAPEHVSSSSVSSITTELQLGTFTPTSQELKKPFFCPNQILPSSPSDLERDCNQILQRLTEKISWQREACRDLAQIVSRRREGENDTRDSWICLTGPDRMGKKKMAPVLAELLFGSRENFIAIDLSIQWKSESNSVVNAHLPDDVHVWSNRKATVDYLAEELRKKPCSLIFLENVDKVDDLIIQTTLSRAIQSGKFQDSRGREISVKNAVFLIAYSSTQEDQCYSDMDSEFTEDRVLKASSWQMQIVIDQSDPSTKRKQSKINSQSNLKKLKGSLDLNISCEDEDSKGGWFQNLLEQVESKIAFKPFDFDALADKLLSKMNLIVQRRSGPGFNLEVDDDVMLQILAAAWCSDQEKAVDNWINEVVCESYTEAQKKLYHYKQTRLKIVSCPGRRIEQQHPGIYLPRRINLS